MFHVVLAHTADWEGWRVAARALALAGIPAAEIAWTVGGGGASALPEVAGGFSAPRGLVAWGRDSIAAREPERFALLYRLVCRARAGEEIDDDPDFTRVRHLALAVRRETHRMQSLLRFLPVRDTAAVRYVGWFEPAHFVQRAVAASYARDYSHLAFSILTPDESAHWTGAAMSHGTGAGLSHGTGVRVESDAALEAAWRARFADLFTDVLPPARNDAAGSLLRAPDRPALGPVCLPAGPDTALLAEEAAGCQRCALWAPATQTVFGEGALHAAIMFIGEQPGDQEDLLGRPFVGPAGVLLDQALEEAGIDRRQVYVTNAVKHFKFAPRGMRRIHQSPDASEVAACRFWLEQERAAVRPALVVLLGATAARAVLGRPVTIGRERGTPFDLPDGTPGFITVHPSFLLRQPDEESKAREYARFVRELHTVATLAARLMPRPMGHGVPEERSGALPPNPHQGAVLPGPPSVW